MSRRKKRAIIGLSVTAALAVAGGVALLVRFQSMIEIPSGSILGPATPSGPTAYGQAIARARQIVLPLLDRYPGVSVAVGAEDTVVWSEGFGFADIEARIAASSQTGFRAYSVAKPLTGLAVLRLFQDGKIDLDAPVGRYVPALPTALGAVTVRQLAGHLSGIRDYRKGEWLELSTRPCSTPREALDAFLQDPLEDPPGSTFRYSSFNYVVLSALITSVSGERFDSYMKTAILNPAGMVASTFDSIGESSSSLSVFYEPGWMGRVRIARPVDNSCKFGAGALITTAEDLVRFGNALLAGRLLDRENFDQAFTSMKTAAGEETGYGLGWGIGADPAGMRSWGHSGGAIGGRSALVVYPDEGVVVAMVANIEGERLTDEAHEIGDLFLPGVR